MQNNCHLPLFHDIAPTRSPMLSGGVSEPKGHGIYPVGSARIFPSISESSPKVRACPSHQRQINKYLLEIKRGDQLRIHTATVCFTYG